MNASHAFRSHLMQQFVTAARNQSRTPIALIGWVQEDKQDLPGEHRGSSSSCSSSATRQQQLSSIRTTTTTTSATATNTNQAVLTHRSYGGSGSASNSEGVGSRSFGKHDDKGDDDDDEEEEELLEEQKPAAKRDVLPSPENSDLTRSFQQLLQSRRTSSRFRNPSAASEPADDGLAPLLTQAQYKSALDRAVRAGRAAPNHKRTEPFTFKRLLWGSSSTERLAEIAEQVYIREKQRQQQRSGNVARVDQETVVRDTARRKREKWSQIPAFLVTLVSSSPPSKTSSPEDDPPHSQATTLRSAGNDTASLDSFSPYDPLPYAPPATERALEDFAAACAATQNVLLSLHAEGLATKWATGSVISTKAFRALVRAEPDERVVALVMVGQPVVATSPSSGSKQYRRRYRRSLEGDVLQDL